jgi:hypothetical protein
MVLFLRLLLKIPELWVPGEGSFGQEARSKHCDRDDCEENLYNRVMNMVQGSLKERFTYTPDIYQSNFCIWLNIGTARVILTNHRIDNKAQQRAEKSIRGNLENKQLWTWLEAHTVALTYVTYRKLMIEANVETPGFIESRFMRLDWM